jgi:acetoin utilization protein AcuC
MTAKTAFLYTDAYLTYQFGSSHPFKPIREKLALDLLQELNVFNGKAEHLEPLPAKREDLLTVHTKEYVDYVQRKCNEGRGYLDYGDTPATKGLYEGALSVVGGSLLGAKLILEGDVDHAFNPGGGLHHAKADRASGFCVFNDIAVAIRFLQKSYGLERIVVIDIDGHHGDGTQELFYDEPVLTISTHRTGIFPGTGYVDEVGVGNGKGYSVNLPLPEGTFHEVYIHAFTEIVPPLVEAYEPEIIISQFGVDGHYLDPLVGLALTTKTYEEVSRILHDLSHSFAGDKLLVVGGGGYSVQAVARCWAIMFSTISQALPVESEERYNQLFDKDFNLREKRVFERVKDTVKRLKESVFHFHDLDS